MPSRRVVKLRQDVIDSETFQKYKSHLHGFKGPSEKNCCIASADSLVYIHIWYHVNAIYHIGL